MIISQKLRTVIFGVFILAGTASSGQYKDIFAALFTSNLDQSSNVSSLDEYHDLFNPLGPKAQSMRNQTYHCLDKPTSPLERGLWIKLGDKLFQYKDRRIHLLNENNELVNFNIYDYNLALKKAYRSLVRLEKRSNYARNIIRTLQSSTNKFVIALIQAHDSYTLFPLPDGRLGVLNNNAYAFQVIESEKLLVDYAPFDQIGSGAEIRWSSTNKPIQLAHELAHAYDANYGLLDDKLMMVYREVISAREVRALYHENMIRKEMKMKLRTKAKSGRAIIWEGVPYTYPLPVSARY